MNWTARLATIFVRNRRLSLLLTIALFVWGAGSYLATPKQYNPRIVAPSFQIFVEFPGASRTEVLEQVTRPMENVLADLPGVEDIYSVTESGGRVSVTVNFFVGEDLNAAKIALDDRMRSNLDLSPLGIRAPLIQSVDPDDVPALTLALTGAPGDQRVDDPVELRRIAFRLRERLVKIPGASNIEVVGGRKRELAILIDPERLAKSGVGIGAIEDALRRANVFLPSGEIKGPTRTIAVEADARVRRAEDLENIVVVTGDFGQIRLKDVAGVREQVVEVDDYVRHLHAGDQFQNEHADHIVLLSIAKSKDANISDVAQSVHETLDRLKSEWLPAGVQAQVIVDDGRTAREEISGLITNLVTAILIVVTILFLFLDVRAALLVAISIPLTLACVFGLAYVTGQNINRITLFALILSLGLLVDNATVVIENIVRLLKTTRDEKQKDDTIIASVGEVGPGLFMSTVTTVLAFLPMAFVTGMMGPYMGPIPFFVPAALIFSLGLSFTLNPYMASLLLRVGGVAGSGDRYENLPAIFQRALRFAAERGARLVDFYRGYLHSVLIDTRRRRLMLGVIGGLLLASFVLPGVGLVKFRMLPKADREQFYIYLDLPAGTPLAETLRVTQQLEKFLLGEREVRMIQSYVGQPPVLDFNGLFRGVSERRQKTQATLRVGLSRPDDRGVTSEELVLELRPRLVAFAHGLDARYTDETLRIKIVEDPPGPPVLSTLLLRVQGNDLNLLEATARDLRSRVAGEIEEVVDTDVSTPEDTNTTTVRIDQTRASASRVSPAQIVDTLNAAYAGRILGVYHNEDNIEQDYIRLRLDPRFRVSSETLKGIVLYNDLGIAVPLASLAQVEETSTSKPLRRENRENTAYVYGDMGDRSITYAAIDILFLLADYQLPGVQAQRTSLSLFGADFRTADRGDVSISIGGEWELTLEVFRDLGIAMGVAVFLVYFVLVAQFNSFREPLIIMSTIPLSLIGVLPGFMVLGFIPGEYFTATSMIGVIALAGIAVNNSIILLEYLNSLKRTGLTIEAALVEAGTTRFLPILLTTITTILGSTTIVGDPVWSGLAFAIILGLGVSSVLTLVVFPALFFIIKGHEWETHGPVESKGKVRK